MCKVQINVHASLLSLSKGRSFQIQEFVLPFHERWLFLIDATVELMKVNGFQRAVASWQSKGRKNPKLRLLEFGAAWVAGEGDDVADVFHAGDELDHPFES